MEFQLLDRGEKIPSGAKNKVYLSIDYWNDYSFVTMFYMDFVDASGNIKNIGNIKIGFKGQTEAIATYKKIQDDFKGKAFISLGNNYFSIGADEKYYKNLNLLENKIKTEILLSTKDLAYQPKNISNIRYETVFIASLLRGVSLTSITKQFPRILKGQPELTNFEFSFIIPESRENSEIRLDFLVEPFSKPSTNIHAIIGRNGVGKTTILNSMVQAIMSKSNKDYRFYSYYSDFYKRPIDNDYFSSLVSVSFSVFDTFEPPKEQSNRALGTCYFYIGLKKSENEIRTTNDIYDDFSDALDLCFSEENKKNRWIKAIRNLEADENFANMQLIEKLASNLTQDELKKTAHKLIKRMSSGHAVILLVMTKLVATVEEKTLILLDEPESHLHPPLLSAFIRALSNLLYDRNGVAIVATHSPVVLQEIPKSCVSKIQRVGLVTNIKRPDIETFGENVGVLTREVFGLEVIKSGFHKLLTQSVLEGKTYEKILEEYNNQLGMEAKVLLKLMINERDRNV